MQIRPKIEPKAKVLVQKEIIPSRLMKVGSEIKSKATSLSKEAIATKLANCNQK